MHLQHIADECHNIALTKGWWENTPENYIPEKLALIHSEISEALEAYRENQLTGMEDDGKPVGLDSELADAVIRIFDLSGYMGIDIEEIIKKKMAYNMTRPHRHGGKRA